MAGTRLAGRQARRVRLRSRAETNNDADVWVRELPTPVAATARAGRDTASARVTRTAGQRELSRVGLRQRARCVRGSRGGSLARLGVGDAVVRRAARRPAAGAAAGRPRFRRRSGAAHRHRPIQPRPRVPPRRGSRLVAGRPDAASSPRSLTPAGGYNGNPNRSDDDPPAAVCAGRASYALWKVAAPRAVDDSASAMTLARSRQRPLDVGVRPGLADAEVAVLRDRDVRRRLGRASREVPAGDGARERRGAARGRDRSHDRRAAADQAGPRIAARRSSRPGHPLASAAGALVLEHGGNVVDAGIAVSFALGVVEPDASSIGGDGQAILFLKGMTEPVVIEYKDMTPSHATGDNPKLFNANGSRTATRRTDGRQHSRRRRRARSALQEVRQQESAVGGSRRAGDQARR